MSKIFRVFNFRRLLYQQKLINDKNFLIYGMLPRLLSILNL